MSKLLTGLNEAQLAAVTGAEGPTMVIAGAGSGKTRVLTTRIAYLLEQGVRSWEILALTFTNKAAGEMKERIAHMIGDSYVHELWMGTFHSIFARILRRNAEAIGYSRSFSIYDTDDTISAIKRIMDLLHIPKDKYNPNAIRSRISSAKNALVLPQEYSKQALDDFSEKTALVYTEYVRMLGESNAMDFDDLLIKTIELFKRHPDILATYQNRFRYILVDEYQDTNRAQYTVVKMLADVHRNLTVVGDDAQSIYAFRGADIKNLFLFQEDYEDVKMFRLEQNYRSTTQILSAANALIKNNKSQIEKNLFTKNAKGDDVQIIECSDDREEGAAVVRFLEEEMRKERYALNDFAVLYRTNAQSRVIEDSFRRQGIPYTIVGGVAFYKRKEIKDVIAYIRLIVNPNDSESLFRVINYPARGIGDTTLDKLAQYARERQTFVFDVLAVPEFIPNVQPRAVNALKTFHSVINKYRSLRSELSPSELLRSLIDDTGILRELKQENTLESLARYENVREFLSAITEYFMEKSDATIESFLEEISLMSDVDSMDGTKNAATLMTIHAAKGLEYPVVFITGVEEGLFPSANAFYENDDIEEERRLMYVALTRAMRKCYISFSKVRMKFGEIAPAVPSRFIKEVEASGATMRMTSYGTRSRSFEFDPDDTSYEGQKSPIYRSNPTSYAAKRKARAPLSGNQYRQEAPQESYSQIESPTGGMISRGAKVWHESFGEGRVIEINGRGEKAKAVVDFAKVGRKHLMLKFAQLKVL